LILYASLKLLEEALMIRTFDKNATNDEILQALNEDGGVIVANLVSDDVVDAVTRELRPYYDKQGTKFQDDFNGYTTLRLYTVPGKSRASLELLAHERVMEIIGAVLHPHCENFQVGSSTSIEIYPGETDQELHRDDDFYPKRIPGVEWQVSALWAFDDFTKENGATRVVPGSHDLRDVEDVTEDDIVQAVMPKGSVLIYMGATLHGGGANNSELPRGCMISTYSLGWLKQEENHYLSIPREVVDSYPDHVRRLLGYQSHGPYLGTYPGVPDGVWTE
jgi:ectoine hydroxylase-related dioxygenase (phytanoyl-CoA dioxygenase family)